jgi:outer membrane protein OmpA-like peptidoglycan-associated protein
MADNMFVGAVTPQADTLLHVTLLMQSVQQVGERFVLEDIYYDFDKHDIRPDAALILDKLVKTLLDNPSLKIELSSHTDSRGSNKYNMALSQRRAQSAVDYIVSRGVDSSRLKAQGYGETRLVNECADGVTCTEEQHQANRRTEIEILEY